MELPLLPSSSARDGLHHLRQRRLARRTSAGLLSRQNSVSHRRAATVKPVVNLHHFSSVLLTLLLGRQEGHPVCEKLGFSLPMVAI